MHLFYVNNVGIVDVEHVYIEILFIVLMVFVSFVESESVHMNRVKAKGQLPFSKLMMIICYVYSHCGFLIVHFIMLLLYFITFSPISLSDLSTCNFLFIVLFPLLRFMLNPHSISFGNTNRICNKSLIDNILAQ